MTSPTPGPQPAVPTSGAYLGAYVNPKNTGGDIVQDCAFEQQIDRSLAVDNHFLKWTQPMPGVGADWDVSNNTIPMLSWTCNANGGSDAQILAGDDDELIKSQAEAIATFGKPVFIRWFWEMDLAGTTAAPCLAGLGSQGYVEAFQYIVTMFRHYGATNAAFVWCPSSYGFLPKPAGNDNALSYYPGSSYVDWIAEDVYDNPNATTTATTQSAVEPFYDATASMGKPLMIAETAAVGADQAPWIWGFGEKKFADAYPAIKDVNYYDAPNYKKHLRWQLEARGLAAFTKLGQKPYFAPMS